MQLAPTPACTDANTARGHRPGQLLSRCFHCTTLIRLVVLCSMVASINYLVWRATASLNPAALVFSLLFLLAESQSFVSFLLFAFMTWDTGRTFSFQLQPRLAVDVFVPTYNEDSEILEATLLGCQAITYPHLTYVLDDGRRPGIRALAKRLGCRYLTRPSNAYAKAGNLNSALARSTGDFIVVLDADTVPQPDFLDKTLGYFVDPAVALVQLPQEFYNVDSLQHASKRTNGAVWHEQQLFYRVIQPGKNRWNAAFWCGSPSVLRRTALLDVGGVATETLTEDLHTTVRLHARGWKTVYHNEVLAYGVAPQTLHAFLLQRRRWAQGTMQLLRSRENPLILPGLSVAQRLNYIGSILSYFDPLQRLVFLLAPSFILLTGVLPMRVGMASFAWHWAPAFLLASVANLLLGRGYFHPIEVDRYNLLKAFAFVRAWGTLIRPSGLHFQVTPKRTGVGVTQREWQLLTPHLAVISVIGASLALGTANRLWHVTARFTDPGAMVAISVWALVNAGLIALAITGVLGRRHARQDYRFPTEMKVIVDIDGISVPTTVSNLSPLGIGLMAVQAIPLTSRCRVTIPLADGPVVLSGEVIYCRKNRGGAFALGVQFAGLDDSQRGRLSSLLFVSLPRRLARQSAQAA